MGPDLSGADLSFTELSFADLSFTNLCAVRLNDVKLSYADLCAADLRNANLNGAQLVCADLSAAHLEAADLSGANLSYANLDEANLSGANFEDTHLNEAQLGNADFSNARVGYTIFGDVDLRQVKGLEKVQHIGPSTIGTNTLLRSEGNIPEIFLRGAGLNNSFIEYVRSLRGHLIQYYSCFICYSDQDKVFAELLHADLQNKGVLCWLAQKDLKIGDHYHQRIDESIRRYDKFVLILSEHAIQSSWVEREVVSAREKEDQLGHAVLFPIRLDDAVMQTTKAWAADVRRRWHIGDFTQWKHHDAYQQAFKRLLRDLKAEQKSKD